MHPHTFCVAYDSYQNCALCDQPRTAQIHWIGDGPLPNDRFEEYHSPDGSNVRPGAAIYEPFDWEVTT